MRVTSEASLSPPTRYFAPLRMTAAPLRMTASQFGVLEALCHLGPMHQYDLGERILKSSGNMTMVIDNLAPLSAAAFGEGS